MSERAFSFIPVNERPAKPRARGVTEIRGPYYAVMGRRYLEDILDTMHPYVDGLKFAGGSFALMPADKVKEMIDLAHRHGVYVSTGGWIEHVLRYGPEAVEKYVTEAQALGFDVIELSAGFISIPADDLLRLIERVAKAGLKAKPELGIQFGAGGATPAAELAAEGTRDAQWVITRAKACLDAGAHMIMIESEGITENVDTWRTDVAAQIINALGIEKTMFEAADPPVFEWYVKNYGPRGQTFFSSITVRSSSWNASVQGSGNQKLMGADCDLQRRLIVLERPAMPMRGGSRRSSSSALDGRHQH